MFFCNTSKTFPTSFLMLSILLIQILFLNLSDDYFNNKAINVTTLTLSSWSKLQHEKGSKLKQCPKVQAQSFKCGSMEECKEINFNIPKWIFSLGIEVPWVFWMFGIKVQITNLFQIDHFLNYGKGIEM